jgi:amino acid transporter
MLPALVFLVPVSLVAAELASGWPGGVFNWVSQGIPARMGLLAIWCEFAQTIFFYPALLAYVAGTLAYVFDPSLAANGVYNSVIIIVLFWAGVAYLVQGHHPAAPMTARHLLPAWNGLASIVLVVNSFFTYTGVEVNAVHVDELRNPAREYPRSIFLAMALVLAVFIGPTLAISWVIPAGQISFTVGVMQAFDSLFTRFGFGFACR